MTPAITLNSGTFDYGTLAAAVSAANYSGDTIHITTVDMPTGGYVGGAAVDKSLTIVGTPDGSGNRPILKAAADTSATSGSVLYLWTGSADVTISNVSITGVGDAEDDYFTSGIWIVGGANLHLSDSDITDITSVPDSTLMAGWSQPGWTGVGVIVDSYSSATLDNVTITGYQLAGVLAQGTGAHVDVIDSTITGQGEIEDVQTGIYIKAGATAHVADSTIEDNLYIGTDAGADWFDELQSVGIRFNEAGVGSLIENNTITNNDVGIAHLATAANSSANATVLKGNTIADNLYYGIALDAGFASIWNNTITGGDYGIGAFAGPWNYVDSVGVLTANTITGYAETATVTDDQADYADAVFIANNAPSATIPTVAVNQYGSVNIPLEEVFTDADEDELTITIDTPPEHGDLDIETDGSVTYTPWPGYFGSDSFVLRVSDGYTSVPATFPTTVKPLVQFSSSQYSIGEGGTATITVTLSGVLTENVTVYYATSDATAEAGDDYTTAAGMVTIPYGETSATFTVAILTDSETEVAETFTITLSSPSANAGLGATTAATFTIYAQFAPEDVLDTLNPLSAKIDALLGSPSEEVNALANEEIVIAPRLETMDDLLGDIGYEIVEAFLENRYVDHWYVSTKLTAFGGNQSLLNESITRYLESVDETIERAEEAAAASEGMKFRIQGIGADMDAMNVRLSNLVDRLDSQKTILTNLSEETSLRQPERARAAGAAFGLQVEMTRITNRMTRASAIFSDNIDNEAANETSETLNSKYGALADLYLGVIDRHLDFLDLDASLTARHDDIANEVSLAQWYYSGDLSTLGYRVYDNCWYVAYRAGEAEERFSVVDIISDSQVVLGADSFAAKGIATIISQFDAILAEEMDRVEYQWNALVDISQNVAVGSALIDNLEAYLTSLTLARAELNSLL